jgi:signal transduction histidine kinase
MRTSIDVTLAKPARSPAQLEEMAAKVRRAVDQADALIDALLTLAVSEQEPIETEPVDLATLAEDALDAAAVAVSRLQLRTDASLEPAPTSGDQVLLERLVGNLVDNAVRHNIDRGWIEVRTGRTDGHAFVTVVNSGVPIPEERVQTLFEPFRKGGERTNDATSIGLGLAIVRSIATAHGGTIDAHSRQEGGLSVTVLLAESDGAFANDAAFDAEPSL